MDGMITDNSWIEIDTAALKKNLAYLTDIAKQHGKTSLLMVKANAYGHGLVPVARLAEKEGIYALGIASLEEARQLREAGIVIPLLLFSELVTPAQVQALVTYSVTPVVGNRGYLEQILSLKKTTNIDFHIKFNSGLNRHGFNLVEAPMVIEILRRSQAVPGGILTHYSSATSDPERTQAESDAFIDVVAQFTKAGLNPRHIHASNSAAVMWHNETSTNLVRLGLAAYGLQPSNDRHAKLYPCFTWKSRLTSIRIIKKGERVGYDGAWTAVRATRLGVVPVGYSDGLRRGPIHQEYFVGNENKLPVIASIMMNHTLLDLNEAPNIQIGEEVIILSNQKKHNLTAEQIAEQIGTSNEEVVTSIRASMPRYY